MHYNKPRFLHCHQRRRGTEKNFIIHNARPLELDKVNKAMNILKQIWKLMGKKSCITNF